MGFINNKKGKIFFGLLLVGVIFFGYVNVGFAISRGETCNLMSCSCDCGDEGIFTMTRGETCSCSSTSSGSYDDVNACAGATGESVMPSILNGETCPSSAHCCLCSAKKWISAGISCVDFDEMADGLSWGVCCCYGDADSDNCQNMTTTETEKIEGGGTVGKCKDDMVRATSAKQCISGYSNSKLIPLDLQIPITDLSGKVVRRVESMGEYFRLIYDWSIGAIAAIAVVMIMIAGFQWLNAAGNEKAIGSAQTRIKNAVFGLALVGGAYLLIQITNPIILGGFGRLAISKVARMLSVGGDYDTAGGLPECGIKLIQEFENLELTAYEDPASGAEPYTVGWGSTKDENGDPFVLGQSITKERANELFFHQLKTEFYPPLTRIPGWDEMHPNQHGALLSFAYNLGADFYDSGPKFNQITTALKNKNWDDVPRIFELYRNRGSAAEDGLLRRRKAEGVMWSDKSTPCGEAGGGSASIVQFNEVGWIFDPGIKDQVPDASNELIKLLNCMITKLDSIALSGVKPKLNSITDSNGIENCVSNNASRYTVRCSASQTTNCCWHVINSCHYGGETSITNPPVSYAVDISVEGGETELNKSNRDKAIIQAAGECGAKFAWGPSGKYNTSFTRPYSTSSTGHKNHVHISVPPCDKN